MTEVSASSGAYGVAPKEFQNILGTHDDARQCSPLIPGSADIAECPDQVLDVFVVAAPAGVQDRRFVMAHALRTLNSGGELRIFAPKKKGGLRLKAELEDLGCSVRLESAKHNKFAFCTPPSDMSAVQATIEENGPRLDEELGYWTQPGVFSWNRPDPGTLLLMENLPELSGRGADLGSGLGLLSHKVLETDTVTQIILADLDRRAIEMAFRNVGDERTQFMWTDVASGRELDEITDLDFVVMNPPFHKDGEEDRSLGQAFVRRAAKLLRKGGVCWLVANRHLPYESELKAHFSKFEPRADSHGFKVIEAIK